MMKLALLALSFLMVVHSQAQKDSLKSGVYSWTKAKVHKVGDIDRRQVLNGSTLDLSNLEIHTSTLHPGMVNHLMKASKDAEELIIIKEGSVQSTVEATTKILGPGGLILLIAGDKQSMKNIGDKPATYYVLVYKSKDGLHAARGKAGGGSFMKDWKDFVTKQTDKGQSRPIFDRPSSMFKRFDVHATTLNPGIESHPPHTHRAEEIILMIKGNGTMQIGEKFLDATPGDVLLVNSLVPHAIKNTGTEQCSYYAIQWHSNAE